MKGTMNLVERTQKTYDEVANQYLVRNKDRSEVAYFMDRFNRLLPYGALILDVGAGPGIDSAELKRHGLQVMSCDLSFGMLEAGQRSYPGIPRVQADMLELPFEASIQGCWVNASLHHVERGLVPKALRELRRVLVEPAILHLEVKLGNNEGWETERYGSNHPRWYTYWQPRDLDQLLVDSGFQLIEGKIRAGRRARWISRLCCIQRKLMT